MWTWTPFLGKKSVGHGWMWVVSTVTRSYLADGKKLLVTFYSSCLRLVWSNLIEQSQCFFPCWLWIRIQMLCGTIVPNGNQKVGHRMVDPETYTVYDLWLVAFLNQWKNMEVKCCKWSQIGWKIKDASNHQQDMYCRFSYIFLLPLLYFCFTNSRAWLLMTKKNPQGFSKT